MHGSLLIGASMLQQTQDRTHEECFFFFFNVGRRMLSLAVHGLECRAIRRGNSSKARKPQIVHVHLQKEPG